MIYLKTACILIVLMFCTYDVNADLFYGEHGDWFDLIINTNIKGKVSEYTRWNTSLINGKPRGSSQISYKYNIKGQPVEYSHGDSTRAPSIFYYKYTYNPNGDIIEKREYQYQTETIKAIQRKSKYKYAPDGRMIEERQYVTNHEDMNFPLVDIIRYKINKNRIMLERSHYGNNESLRQTLKYNESGEMTNNEIYNAGKLETSYHLNYLYNNQGKLIEKLMYRNGRENPYWKRKYNSYGSLTEVLFYHQGNGQIQSKSEYNIKGHIIKRSDYSTTGILHTKIEYAYKYNADDNFIESIEQIKLLAGRPFNKNVKYINKYQYDHEGNVTEKARYKHQYDPILKKDHTQLIKLAKWTFKYY